MLSGNAISLNHFRGGALIILGGQPVDPRQVNSSQLRSGSSGQFFYSIKKEGDSRIFQAQDRAIDDFTLKGHPVTVEFDLMQPLLAFRRRVERHWIEHWPRLPGARTSVRRAE